MSTPRGRIENDFVSAAMQVKHVALYGAGKTASSMFELLDDERNVIIDHIVDSSPQKWGESVGGSLKVENPRVLEGYRGEVVVACAGGWSLRRQIQNQFGLVPNYERYWLVHQSRLVKFWNSRQGDLESIRSDLADTQSRDLLAFITGEEPKSNAEILQLSVEESYFSPQFVRQHLSGTLILGGASEGEEVHHLSRIRNVFDHIALIEPSKVARVSLRKALREVSLSNSATVVACALGREEGWTSMLGSGVSAHTRSPAEDLSEVSQTRIRVRTIDSLALQFSNPSLITLDIEGDELSALEGARNTIENDKPLVAVSVYHRPHDIFDVWNFFRSTSLEWSLFLRALDFGLNDVTLFAVPLNPQS